MKRISGTAIAATLFILWPVLARANCVSKVFNQAYNCDIYYDGSNATYCIEFGEFGLSVYFDDADYFNREYLGCSCNDSGSATSPKMDSSSDEFTCTGDSLPSTFVGKVSGKKLSGQSYYENGDSAIYSCVKISGSCP